MICFTDTFSSLVGKWLNIWTGYWFGLNEELSDLKVNKMSTLSLPILATSNTWLEHIRIPKGYLILMYDEEFNVYFLPKRRSSRNNSIQILNYNNYYYTKHFQWKSSCCYILIFQCYLGERKREIIQWNIYRNLPIANHVIYTLNTISVPDIMILA